MPELPEMRIIAEQMARTLRGKEIRAVSIFQPKCLNRPEADYHRVLPGKRVRQVRPLGKWVEIDLTDAARLLISLGMGGELCSLEQGQSPPEKTRVLTTFTDGTGFFMTLWWFWYIHLVLDGEDHAMTDSLGPDPLELSAQEFRALLNRRRGSVKSLLLNQKLLRGIGNFYIQEILFKARLHPFHPVPSLSAADANRLHKAIQDVLTESIRLGSSSYEPDFFGRKGSYGLNRLSFAYQEGATCPRCGTAAKKIKTGATTQYICPTCQKLP